MEQTLYEPHNIVRAVKAVYRYSISTPGRSDAFYFTSFILFFGVLLLLILRYDLG